MEMTITTPKTHSRSWNICRSGWIYSRSLEFGVRESVLSRAFPHKAVVSRVLQAGEGHGHLMNQSECTNRDSLQGKTQEHQSSESILPLPLR